MENTRLNCLLKVFGWEIIAYCIIGLIEKVLLLSKLELQKGYPLTNINFWIVVLFLISGIGLVNLRHWGRRLIILVALIRLYFYKIAIIHSDYITVALVSKKIIGIPVDDLICLILFTFIALVVILIFIHPKVKEQFK